MAQKTSKLHQVIAVEKQIKDKAMQARTAAHRAKDPEFFGLTKVYSPLEEGGLVYPPEAVQVQRTVRGLIESITDLLARAYDIEATKNETNTRARADIVLEDGTVIAESVVGPTLLHLEKDLDLIRTFIKDLPVLDAATKWSVDGQVGLWRSDEAYTTRTKKTERPLVLYPATEKHAAQVKTIVEDVVEGTWTTTKFSGAIPVTTKIEMLDRVDSLQSAIKKARSVANEEAVAEVKIGAKVLDFIFTAR